MDKLTEVLEGIGLVLLTLLILIVVYFLLGWCLMIIWNSTLVPLFCAPVIKYGQAVGLVVLLEMIKAKPMNFSIKNDKTSKC